MKKSEEKQVDTEPVGPVAMLAPPDQLNGVHVGLTDGSTFYIPPGEVATLVPAEFQEAALAAGAIPAAAGTPTTEHVDTKAEKEVIEDEKAAEARLKKAKGE